MEGEELETYAEVPTEDDYDDYEDSILDSDFVYYGFFAILGCKDNFKAPQEYASQSW